MLRHCIYNSQITHVRVCVCKYVCVWDRVNMVHNLQVVDDIWENWVKKIVKVFSYFCNFSPSLFQNKNVNFLKKK